MSDILEYFPQIIAGTIAVICTVGLVCGRNAAVLHMLEITLGFLFGVASGISIMKRKRK